jgi:hypothetical protein
MRTITKNLLIASTLGLMATSAFSQVNERSEERRSRYRDIHRNMNICSEIKEDLLASEARYEDAANRITSADRRISQQQRVIRARRNTLESKKSAFETAKAQVIELTKLKADKPRLMGLNNRILTAANTALPGLSIILNEASDEKKKKCKGAIRLGRRARACKAAKKALKSAQNNYNATNNKKIAATNMITKLNRVESDLIKVEQIKIAAKSSLRHEEDISPSIAQLSTSLRQLVEIRNQDQIAFTQVEEIYGRLEVRLEKCQTMRYDAKRGKAFKRALLVFAKDNGLGCDQAVRLISSAKTPAAKDGINEAYELVCNSNILVRVVSERAPAVDPVQ